MAFSAFIQRFIGLRKKTTSVQKDVQLAKAHFEVEKVSCETHGSSHQAFVCRHLLTDPVQAWFCGHPTEDNRWPDAWCAECDVEYLKEGEWNEKNEMVSDIAIICSHCYESARSKSISRLKGRALEAWTDYVDGCIERIKSKQEKIMDQYKLGDFPRWDWDQENGTLVFSVGDVPKIVAEIEFIGSVSTKSSTWLWAWANFMVLDNVRARICEVRDFGQKKDFPRLTTPKWEADEVDGWEMAAIAADIIGARGVYRAPSQTGFTFLALMNIHYVE